MFIFISIGRLCGITQLRLLYCLPSLLPHPIDSPASVRNLNVYIQGILVDKSFGSGNAITVDL